MRSERPNQLVVQIDGHAATADVAPGDWRDLLLSPADFQNYSGEPLAGWQGVKELKLSDAERLRAPRGASPASRIIGKNWSGPPPEFRNLRWVAGP